MAYQQWNLVVLIVILIFYAVGSSIAANSTATGTVFLDTNGNQVRDDNEPGLPGGSRLQWAGYCKNRCQRAILARNR